MTDAELRDAAVAELKLTTVGYKNKHWTTPPEGSQWDKGLDLLAQIGQQQPEPPPSGTVREAQPGQAASVINAAQPGDTVLLRGGTHPFFTLPKSFAEPRLTVKCEQGTKVQGIDTGAQDGYIFDSCRFERQVNYSNIDDSCFYVHGTSQRIRLVRSVLVGGGITLKVYCGTPNWAEELEVIDCDVSGGGIDVSHWNGARTFRVEHSKFHDPSTQPGSHQDCIQMTRARDFVVERSEFYGPNLARDGVSQAWMIGSTPQGGEARAIVNATFVNNWLHDWPAGDPCNFVAIDGLKLINNTVESHASGYASFTFEESHGPLTGVEVWNNDVISMYRTGSVSYPGDITFCEENRVRTGAGGNFTGVPVKGNGLERAGTPAVNIDGTLRPSPPGIGCR